MLEHFVCSPRIEQRSTDRARIVQPMGLIVVAMTEMIGDSTGLGYYIQYQAASFEYPSSYAGMPAIAIIELVLDRGLVVFRSVLLFLGNAVEDCTRPCQGSAFSLNGISGSTLSPICSADFA